MLVWVWCVAILAGFFGILKIKLAVVLHVDLDGFQSFKVCAGFEVRDAIALLRLDDLYIECFEIKDVKVLYSLLLIRIFLRITDH